jgi:hypothetical protein
MVHGPVQSAAWVTVHRPYELQHAPVGLGQVFGSQVRPAVQRPVQFAAIFTEQLPSAAQQDPGCGQSFGTQAPNIVQVPVQSAAKFTAQVPFG